MNRRIGGRIAWMINKAAWLAWKAWFCAVYRGSFRSFGKKASIGPRVRLDGAEYITIGSGAVIREGAWLAAMETLPGEKPSLSIGEVTYLGRNAHIVAVKNVDIGNKVLIADRVYISDNAHGYSDVVTPIMEQPVSFIGDVVIGDGSWIGENVCIIGAKVGKNSVIGANSVVTKDIPDYSVAVGAPARVIKRWDESGEKWVRIE